MQQVNNVVIIDDEPFMNLINEKIIQKADFAQHVKSYLDAADALERLKEMVSENNPQFPDCIFIDVNMPGMDGWAFLDELGKFPENVLKQCRIFLLSASVSPLDIERSKPYSMVRDFISKPLSADKLGKLNL